MDVTHMCLLTLKVAIFTTFLIRWISAVPVPPDKDFVKQNLLVTRGNNASVTSSNRAQLEKEGLPSDPISVDNSTVEWNAKNLVTNVNNHTWPAVSNDNNLTVTTAVSTVTIPASQHYHGHDDDDYVQFDNPENLRPKTGIDFRHTGRSNILLEHSKTVEEYTSSDFIIRGHDITTPDPRDTPPVDADNEQRSLINTDPVADYVTQDQQISVDSFYQTTTTAVSPSREALETTSEVTELETTYSSSFRLEHGNTLTGLTEQGTYPTVHNNIQSESTVSYTISQPSLFITLLLSTTDASDSVQENQGTSLSNYPTSVRIVDHDDDETSTVGRSDVFTELAKHTITKRETLGSWDYNNYQTTEARIPAVGDTDRPVPTDGQTEPSNPFTKRPATIFTALNSRGPNAGSGDPDNDVQSQGHTTTATTTTPRGQSSQLTTRASETSQAAGIFQQTTTMVYIASSDVTDNGNYLFDGFDGLDGKSDFKVKDIVLAVCGTVGCMLTVCMMVAFTRCCCKKEKDDDDEESGGGGGGGGPSGTLKALRSLKRRSKRRSSNKDNTGISGARESATDTTQVSVECHSDGKRQSWCHDDSSFFNTRDPKNNGLRASQKQEISVKDRIKAFETKTDPLDVKLRDDNKPRKKKPKSKAFEDFESQGILIGFGNHPRKRHLADDEDAEENEDSPENADEADDQCGLPFNMSQSFTSTRESGDIEDDDFEAVQRNTEILKSFRRAPPPKNRSRARRSGRRGRHRPVQSQDTRSEGGRDTGDGASVNDAGSVYSAPVYRVDSQDSELDRFEASLHMPVDRSHSAREISSNKLSRSNSRDSSQCRTVTIQVPTPVRTSEEPGRRQTAFSNGNYPGGEQANYSTSGDLVTARRIQPEGATERETCDLDFRHRCHSDSRPGLANTRNQRPLSCFSNPPGGNGKVAGLPPKGIPKSYSQRLERTPPPMDNYTAQHRGVVPPYTHHSRPPITNTEVLPPSNQQPINPPIDSLRHAMMRRWESEHSFPRGNSTQGQVTNVNPMASQHKPAGSNERTGNIFEGHFPRSETLARKFNSADSVDNLGKPDSPVHLNGTAQSDLDTPVTRYMNGSPQPLPPLSLSRHDYRHTNTAPRWEIRPRQSVFPMLAREIELNESAERLPYTPNQPTVKFNINTPPTNV